MKLNPFKWFKKDKKDEKDEKDVDEIIEDTMTDFEFFKEDDPVGDGLELQASNYNFNMLIMDICRYKKYETIQYENDIKNKLLFIIMPDRVVYRYWFMDTNELKSFENTLDKALKEIGIKFEL